MFIIDKDDSIVLQRITMFQEEKLGKKSPLDVWVLGGDGTFKNPFKIKDDEHIDFIMEERCIIKAIYGDFTIKYHGPIDNPATIDSMDVMYFEDNKLKEKTIYFYLVHTNASKNGIHLMRHN